MNQSNRETNARMRNLERSFEDDSQTQIIVLANQPRMLREMLHRVLAAAGGEQLIVEIDDPNRIPAILRRIRVDWLILSLPTLLQPPAPLQEAIARAPSLSLLGISKDGAHVQVRKPEEDGYPTAGIIRDGESSSTRHFTLVEAALPDLLAVLGVDGGTTTQSPS